MRRTRDEIMADIIPLLAQLADDWEYTGDITQKTRLFTDLGFESLDVVVLSTSIQEHYTEVLPFHLFFAELGERNQRDVSLGEWVDFIYEHLDHGSS